MQGKTSNYRSNTRIMSSGSLSLSARLPEEQAENSCYFYELASAKFGFSEGLLPKVQAFHFKGGQGAKTGTGGHLPGNKVKGKIADVGETPKTHGYMYRGVLTK